MANLEFGLRGAHLHLHFPSPSLFFLLLHHFPPPPPLDSWFKFVGDFWGLHGWYRSRGAGAPPAPSGSAAGGQVFSSDLSSFSIKLGLLQSLALSHLIEFFS